jgi:hypothetical protein
MLVIGSQSILGSYDEADLPDRTTLSREADIAFWDDDEEIKSDRVDGAIGELSPFDNEFGIYAQGVSISTAILPGGWEGRLVKFQNPQTNGAVAWCLEAHDLALSKLAAMRPKDYEFVGALLDAGLIRIDTLRERAPTLPMPGNQVRVVSRWLDGWHPRR